MLEGDSGAEVTLFGSAAVNLRPFAPCEPTAAKSRVPRWANWAVYKERDGAAVLCGFTDSLERAERMLAALGAESWAEAC